ncbi:hypothetical protein M409DRAFT_58040 [Zasmidium cellare ATCC 36951]|uniref:Heme haloperoxidase family profile domain-containing protein n=1 Tax=Zasmidium cellare ATCC 36951 TaxID=1080233 RepID=A0A6A6C8R3_ZASCE|nr:uncharacterized protein M409DRAFT_58040 [Zasmidium cellare ATCC 36951]KAF2162620.1 hypothetical protein M409DRAFT_58040 [Zasmidium cellare ATCC 36951]
MKFSTSHKLVAAMATTATAFPFAALQDAARDPKIMEIANEHLKRQGVATADAATLVFEPVPIFNAEKQYIDISEGSGHAYVAPGPNDLRGPCPGLNAFANHGFLPHNGYATIPQFLDATMNVVGMGPILAVFLATFGAVIDGSGTAWSIGGTPPASLGGLLGGGNGISGSHNKYESDASPTRPDLYQEGNDYKTKESQFDDLINTSPGGYVDLNSLTDFRSKRFDQQINDNPYFFNGPFTGVLVQPAAYTFIYRFMANHSEEHPYGQLSYDNIATWFGMTGEPGAWTANQGQEKIPENWYRRALEYPYDNFYFFGDVINAAALHPKFLDVGGPSADRCVPYSNTGTTNSFTGVDISNLTGGVLNAGDLTQGNKFACLAFQAAAQAKPDVLLGAITQLTNSIGDITSKLACPQLQGIDDEQLTQFPGYAKSQQ